MSLQIVSWVLFTYLLSFVRVEVNNLLRLTGGERGTKVLFWSGASTQIGSFVGALTAFLLVNVAVVFTSWEEQLHFPNLMYTRRIKFLYFDYFDRHLKLFSAHLLHMYSSSKKKCIYSKRNYGLLPVSYKKLYQNCTIIAVWKIYKVYWTVSHWWAVSKFQSSY